MTKVIAAINMTIDGFCDHTVLSPDEEIHDHYTELLHTADAILYGRTTYQLMEFWRPLLETPSPEKSMNDFATAIDRVPKIVFSRTLKDVDWNTASLSRRNPEDEVQALKQQSMNRVFVGSRSIMLRLMKADLIDEYQLCIHPVLAAGGLPLFDNISEKTVFKLTGTKVFRGGAVILYYERNES